MAEEIGEDSNKGGRKEGTTDEAGEGDTSPESGRGNREDIK